MASQKSKTEARNGSGWQVKSQAKSTLTTAFFVGFRPALPKGATGFKLKVSDNATKALTENPKRVKALLQVYGDALDRSRSADRQVSFRIDVDPEGEVVVTPVEEAIAPPAPVVKDDVEPDIELQGALAAARERGQLRAAEILGGEDMLSADEFAKLLGTTRVTVNTKRHNCQILGLDGAKRGFRFPAWQLDSEGKPYAELAALHERLGGPWAVYRFLVQPHGELGGLTGRQALERGKSSAALEAAESVGRDFR